MEEHDTYKNHLVQTKQDTKTQYLVWLDFSVIQVARD